MTKRSEKNGPYLQGATDNMKCDRCGTMLCLGTDTNGVGTEWCPAGCFNRVVPRRRSSCPECGEGIWDAELGCRECGHGWKVRAFTPVLTGQLSAAQKRRAQLPQGVAPFARRLSSSVGSGSFLFTFS